MTQTRLMRADDIAQSFNTCVERQYWRAVVGGSRTHPEVHFHSRSSMVQVSYRVATNDFTVSFTKATCAFGDFMSSTYKSLTQIIVALKAVGFPINAPLGDEPTLRLEYDPATKAAIVHLGNLGADWFDAEPLPFKVPERESAESIISGVDSDSTPP